MKKTKTNRKMKTKTIKSTSTSGFKHVICSRCNKTPMKIDENSATGICWICVTRMVDPPTFTTIVSSGRPRGWQFMHEFVDKDGNVFHKGEEQPKLKGTLSPTKPKESSTTKKKVTKRERDRIKQEASAKMFDLKKKLVGTKTKAAKKKIEIEIKKLEKIIK